MALLEAVLASAPEWPAIMQAFKDRLEDNSIVTEDEIRCAHRDSALVRATLPGANAAVAPSEPVYERMQDIAEPPGRPVRRASGHRRSANPQLGDACAQHGPPASGL